MARDEELRVCAGTTHVHYEQTVSLNDLASTYPEHSTLAWARLHSSIELVRRFKAQQSNSRHYGLAERLTPPVVYRVQCVFSVWIGAM
jgi:hypothetical protein